MPAFPPARSNVPAPRDIARQAAIDHAQEIIAAYRNGWQGGDWRAADAFLTRVFGKPTEHVITETSGKPLHEWDADELDRELARLLAEHGEG